MYADEELRIIARKQQKINKMYNDEIIGKHFDDNVADINDRDIYINRSTFHELPKFKKLHEINIKRRFLLDTFASFETIITNEERKEF